MEDFCKYFAEEKPRYTLAEIEAKREKVIEMVEKEAGKRITVDNIKTVMTPDMMMKIVDKIDDLFFENRLMRAFNENSCILTACIENRCTKVAGKCLFRKETKSGNACKRILVKMMSKVFINSFKNVKLTMRGVDDVKCNNILECFILTFEHELTHAILFCLCQSWDDTDSGAGNWTGISRPSNGHSKTFMSILFNVFGHTKYTHNLNTGMIVREVDEKSYTIDQLKVGDKIIVKTRFKDNEGMIRIEKFQAVIVSINKRVKKGNNITIRVPSWETFQVGVGTVPSQYKIHNSSIVNIIGDKGDIGTSETENVTVKKPSTTVKKPSTTVKKPSTTVKVADRLVKNLNVGDKIIVKGKLPKMDATGYFLAEITGLNRRKRSENINVVVLDDSPDKGRTAVLSEIHIITMPGEPMKPAPIDMIKQFRGEKTYKYNSIDSIPFTSKPDDFKDDMDSIDVKDMSPGLLSKIKKLTRFNWPSEWKYPGVTIDKKHLSKIKQFPWIDYGFIAKLSNKKYVLANTSGSDYIRYGIILKNADDVIPQSGFIDLLQKEAECTTRNPDPPCGPGMVEKKRPNGAVCCYKDTMKITKKVSKRPDAQKTTTHNKTQKTISKPVGKCTTRNPDPPCGPGMVEKKRPNGAVCCYKHSGKVTIKKPQKAKKIASKTSNKTLKKIQGKCTTRNPDPPCGPGMVVKRRPNGAMCCYKHK
jgi:hypothetical protein